MKPLVPKTSNLQDLTVDSTEPQITKDFSNMDFAFKYGI